MTGNDESLGKSDPNPKNVSVICGEKSMTHVRKGKVVSKKKDMTHACMRKVIMNTYEKQDVSYVDMVRKRLDGSITIEGHVEYEIIDKLRVKGMKKS